MNHPKPIVDQPIGIGREHWDVPVQVELKAYLRFSRRMAWQLRRLVARWTHTATPTARGARDDRTLPWKTSSN
ncbi:MAG: hypothetical protein LLF97_02530 [Planctomycetaceae bacterium]|nr:hypothetical protein [Planctomycetaceae bacterium]